MRRVETLSVRKSTDVGSLYHDTHVARERDFDFTGDPAVARARRRGAWARAKDRGGRRRGGERRPILFNRAPIDSRARRISKFQDKSRISRPGLSGEIRPQ